MQTQMNRLTHSMITESRFFILWAERHFHNLNTRNTYPYQPNAIDVPFPITFNCRSNLKANENKATADRPIPKPCDEQLELQIRARLPSTARVDARPMIFAEACGIMDMARTMVSLSRSNKSSAGHVSCVLE
jgi:hypothetical protein